MNSHKADACVYILTGMLQRRELAQPGYIAELIAGVEGDKAGTPTDVPNLEHVEAIFSEASVSSDGHNSS